MSYSTFDDLKAAVEEFNLNHRRPHGEIRLIDLVDISKQSYASWPSNEHPGVYVFLDRDKKITYIGKASFNSCIGARLSARFDSKWNPKTDAAKGCIYITTIPLRKEFAFEAPAIEEYLLSKLTTRSNSVGNL